jgi:hypothetical protein
MERNHYLVTKFISFDKRSFLKLLNKLFIHTHTQLEEPFWKKILNDDISSIIFNCHNKII